MNTIKQYLKYALDAGHAIPAIIFGFLFIMSIYDKVYSMTAFSTICFIALLAASINDYTNKRENNYLGK